MNIVERKIKGRTYLYERYWDPEKKQARYRYLGPKGSVAIVTEKARAGRIDPKGFPLPPSSAPIEVRRPTKVRKSGRSNLTDIIAVYVPPRALAASAISSFYAVIGIILANLPFASGVLGPLLGSMGAAILLTNALAWLIRFLKGE